MPFIYIYICVFNLLIIIFCNVNGTLDSPLKKSVLDLVASGQQASYELTKELNQGKPVNKNNLVMIAEMTALH